MTKVEANTNNWYGLDQPAGSTGNTLEIKPKPRRPSPFADFAGWRSGAPNDSSKPAQAAPKPAAAPKPIDTSTALGAAFKKASDAMKDYVHALEQEPQDLKDIKDKEANAAKAQSELSNAITDEARLMHRHNQVDTLEHAILDIVWTHVERRKVETASEVLFRAAATKALNLVRTSPAP